MASWTLRKKDRLMVSDGKDTVYLSGRMKVYGIQYKKKNNSLFAVPLGWGWVFVYSKS